MIVSFPVNCCAATTTTTTTTITTTNTQLDSRCIATTKHLSTNQTSLLPDAPNTSPFNCLKSIFHLPELQLIA